MEKSKPRQATESTQAYWQEHVDRWRESGLTQSAYCCQAALSRHRFKYWRHKLEPAAVKPQRRQQGSDFVSVHVQPSTLEPGLTLTLANGMVLRGIEANNVEVVGRLVAQL